MIECVHRNMYGEMHVVAWKLQQAMQLLLRGQAHQGPRGKQGAMATQPTADNEEVWLYSKVKEQLFQDVCNGNGLLKTPAKVVWQSREMYSKMPYALFSSRYYALRGRANDKAIIANDEERLLDLGLRNNVYRLARQDGAEPYWDGSKAQQLLTEDLKCQEKYDMKPRVLRLTREEYKVYNQDSFRQYFNQEKRTIKLKQGYSKKKKRAGI